MINKEKISFYTLALAFFFLLIKISYIPFLPIAPLNLILVLSIIGVLFIVKIKKNTNTKFALIIFTYGFINLIVNYFKFSTLDFSQFSNYILVSSLILHAENIESFKFKERILNWYFFVGFISIFYGYLIYYFGSPFVELRTALIEINTDLSKFNRLGIVGGEKIAIVGFSATSALYGYFIGSYFIMTLHKFLEKRNYLFLFLACFSFFSLTLNGERSVVFFTFVCVFGIIPKKIFTRKIFTLMTLIFLSAFYFQIELTAFNRIADTSLNNSSDDIIPRIKRQYVGLLTFLKNPIFGSSIDEYFAIKDNFFNEDKLSIVSSHNAYINSLINIGFLALILTYKYVINIFKLKKKYVHNNGLFFALLFTLLNAIFHNAGPLNSLEVSSVTILLLLLINTNYYNASDKHNYGRIQRC